MCVFIYIYIYAAERQFLEIWCYYSRNKRNSINLKKKEKEFTINVNNFTLQMQYCFHFLKNSFYFFYQIRIFVSCFQNTNISNEFVRLIDDFNLFLPCFHILNMQCNIQIYIQISFFTFFFYIRFKEAADKCIILFILVSYLSFLLFFVFLQLCQWGLEFSDCISYREVRSPNQKKKELY